MADQYLITKDLETRLELLVLQNGFDPYNRPLWTLEKTNISTDLDEYPVPTVEEVLYGQTIREGLNDEAQELILALTDTTKFIESIRSKDAIEDQKRRELIFRWDQANENLSSAYQELGISKRHRSERGQRSRQDCLQEELEASRRHLENLKHRGHSVRIKDELPFLAMTVARLNESYKSLGVLPGEKEKMEALIKEIELKQKKPYYDTNGRRGLLVSILNWDISKFEKGHRKDKERLESFFHGTLNFEMKEMKKDRRFNIAGVKQFLREVKKKLKENPESFYCVVFCISSHGNENGIFFEDGYLKFEELKCEFGNGSFGIFAGRPKIFLVDACRGDVKEGSPAQRKFLPKKPEAAMTNDSDSLTLYATTKGKLSWEFDSGSLGLQNCIETFQEEWMYTDLYDMLITTQEKIAKGKLGCKQTAEVTTTLLKRFRFQPAFAVQSGAYRIS